MAKYLFLKHYRGAPPMATDVPMSEWAPDAVEAHNQFSAVRAVYLVFNEGLGTTSCSGSPTRRSSG